MAFSSPLCLPTPPANAFDNAIPEFKKYADKPKRRGTLVYRRVPRKERTIVEPNQVFGLAMVTLIVSLQELGIFYWMIGHNMELIFSFRHEYHQQPMILNL
jgi:hypothetical protein